MMSRFANSCLSVSCMFVAFATSSLAAAVDPGEDFAGYMEDLEKRREGQALYKARLREHEIWRQTTWGGWFTRQLQAIGKHFSPFFEALSDAITNEGDSAGSMALLVLVRILIIGSCIAAVFLFSRILNMVVGGYIVVEEVVVEEEEDEPNAGAVTTRKKTRKKRDSKKRE